MEGHAGYIAAAYGFTALVLTALIVWSLAQYRAHAAALKKLESKSGRKR